MAKRGKRANKIQYMKMVLRLAFVQITVFTVWQMIVFTITGNEASTLIQWFFTLWGIEVGLLMLKKILEGKRPKGGDAVDASGEDSEDGGQ